MCRFIILLYLFVDKSIVCNWLIVYTVRLISFMSQDHVLLNGTWDEHIIAAFLLLMIFRYVLLWYRNCGSVFWFIGLRYWDCKLKECHNIALNASDQNARIDYLKDLLFALDGVKRRIIDFRCGGEISFVLWRSRIVN